MFAILVENNATTTIAVTVSSEDDTEGRAVHDPPQNLCSAILILCTCTGPVHLHVHVHIHAHVQVCILRMHFCILCNVELHLWFTSWYHQTNHLWLSHVLACVSAQADDFVGTGLPAILASMVVVAALTAVGIYTCKK